MKLGEISIRCPKCTSTKVKYLKVLNDGPERRTEEWKCLECTENFLVMVEWKAKSVVVKAFQWPEGDHR